MTALALVPNPQDLPSLIDRAITMVAGAVSKVSAENLAPTVSEGVLS